MHMIYQHCWALLQAFSSLAVSSAWYFTCSVKRDIHPHEASSMPITARLRCMRAIQVSFIFHSRYKPIYADLNIAVCQSLISLFSHVSLHIGIPLTIQSNRPSSRSSQRSNGSLSSISRRHSKGVSVSQSRQGQARSAAILLYTCHLDALRLRDQPSHSISSESHLLYQKKSFSHEIIMMKHIEQQIEEQKRMLLIDLPELRNHNTLMRKLNLLPRSEIDLTQYYRHCGGSSSGPKRQHRRFFGRLRRQKTDEEDDDDNHYNGLGCGRSHSRSGDGGSADDGLDNNDDNMDERSVSGDEMSTVDGVVRTSPRRFHTAHSNPLEYDDFEDIDAEYGDDDGFYGNVSLNSQEEFHRYVIDDEIVIIGALPTPTTSNGPSIVVKSSNPMIDVLKVRLTMMCYT